MEKIQNKFGSGILYNSNDLKCKIYARCCACMSVWSDFLSWANLEPERFVKTPEEADVVVVLGCQVTDLAVLNDLRNVEQIYSIYKKDIYLGGCIALRFDIEVPDYVKRLNVVRSIKTQIKNKSLIDFAKPFWVKDFKDTENNLSEGNLFRNMYPLKIGAGCTKSCKYCTIRFTRGESYEMNAYEQIDEFLQNEDVVLISDSPTSKQIEDWCNIAIEHKKQISIRNLEPNVAMEVYEFLLRAAENGVLKILHAPIQSCMSNVLKAMGRNAELTMGFIDKVKELREHGVIVATNIIIDYEVNDETINNMNDEFMKETFDYYVWNPYWNGDWNRERAEERFKKYIG